MKKLVLASVLVIALSGCGGSSSSSVSAPSWVKLGQTSCNTGGEEVVSGERWAYKLDGVLVPVDSLISQDEELVDINSYEFDFACSGYNPIEFKIKQENEDGYVESSISTSELSSSYKRVVNIRKQGDGFSNHIYMYIYNSRVSDVGYEEITLEYKHSGVICESNDAVNDVYINCNDSDGFYVGYVDYNNIIEFVFDDFKAKTNEYISLEHTTKDWYHLFNDKVVIK